MRRASAQRFQDFGASMLRLGSDEPFEGAKAALQQRLEREERASMPGGGRDPKAERLQMQARGGNGVSSPRSGGGGGEPQQDELSRNLRRMSMPGGIVLRGGKALAVASDMKMRHSSDSSLMKGVLCC